MNRYVQLLTFAACLAACPALAQLTPPVAGGLPPSSQSPTGGIPPAADGAGDRTGSLTGAGQTKPPGSPVGDNLGTRPDLEQKSREIDRQISTGICKGCN